MSNQLNIKGRAQYLVGAINVNNVSVFLCERNRVMGFVLKKESRFSTPDPKSAVFTTLRYQGVTDTT